MKMKIYEKKRPHPLAVKEPSIHAPLLKFLAASCIAGVLSFAIELITGVPVYAPLPNATATGTEWHPGGAKDAVRLYSMYPDDVTFSSLRQGNGDVTCIVATGTWSVGARETRRFVYDSTGLSSDSSHYHKACDQS
ncbi:MULTISPECIES: hypothetical protein [unclassified Burkholderia]|uniref:hypothetical protein n=1 Tax=unclassified Burkholderia TaxID=2613784 RepID=UPI001421D306|nr:MULTISPECIES: hypothetical protein [unclassified Burkholderia]NIE57781.1 hypothetical protein [Burkholderia sp. Ap-955]NIF10774.1 hypothetical protein [Burkholderia sp. Ax-1735]NIG02502.1 hypothetical protein [Burkholderia sp. Tr-849]